MRIREFFGKIRKKIIRVLLGRELYERLIRPTDLNSIKNEIQNIINWQSNKIYNAYLKTTPHSYLDFVEIHLTEHCNLNCWGCSHFSPLADEQYLDVGQFESDMKRLYELSSGNIGRINLMGGEPLLHPELLEFFKISRSLFKHSIIRLVTNGLLLNDMEEKFWLAVKNNNIHITPTKYPVRISWDSIEKKAMDYGIRFYYFTDSDKYIKTMNCIALDLEGKQNQLNGFLHCHEGNKCIHLRKGRLYTCPIAAYAEHFNKFFKQDIDLSENNSINIYEAGNMKEILEFLAKPIPFCRYCNVPARTGDHIWQTSKKDISEWAI